MDEFEQSNLVKETNDPTTLSIKPHNTFYQNAIHYKEKENAVIKKYMSGIFSLVFVI